MRRIISIIALLMIVGSVGYTAARITNSDISASAAIAWSKMANLTTNRVLVSDGSGDASASSVTDTTLGYLDATSSIQTQLDAKQALDADLTAIAALAGTDTIYYRSGAATWSAVTVSSDLSFSSGTLSLPAPTASAISGSVIDWSILLKRGGLYTKSLGSSTTALTFANQGVGTIVVKIAQTSGGPTWPSGVQWSAGVTPDVTSNGTDIYTFIYDGSSTIGSAVLDVR